ncbi:Hypothetical protein CINCED_3A020230 [Cinara cedri]|uniref:Reverse transcriptase domain n=1 Tax=Cinara cedri TaxID=506608 RepID=A0A5E4N2U5_9HEMI|nr:Hypothetical protein CINCED_3A020230 [Cinara cedri]
MFWGPAKKSNCQTVHAFQSICLRIITKAPWYVTNKLLHDELQIKTIQDTAIIFYKRFHGKLSTKPYRLISQLVSKTLPDKPIRPIIYLCVKLKSSAEKKLKNYMIDRKNNLMGLAIKS